MRAGKKPRINRCNNGSEFVEHEAIATALNADFDFAHPYSLSERGLTKDLNGLLRQYILKGTDLTTIDEDFIALTVNRINERSRKSLGYRQPKVVFNELRQAV
ncbi:MAG: hypothetical protein LPH21_03025 [Shewanella sp.]|nr:hypothetical protein [Shewanella sp.]